MILLHGCLWFSLRLHFRKRKTKIRVMTNRRRQRHSLKKIFIKNIKRLFQLQVNKSLFCAESPFNISSFVYSRPLVSSTSCKHLTLFTAPPPLQCSLLFQINDADNIVFHLHLEALQRFYLITVIVSPQVS